jgi:FtsP/CotA-like multicopper oxidase with cupredoxin domain
MKHGTDPNVDPSATFSTDTEGLEDAARPALVELADGDRFELRIAPVAKTLGDDRVRMLSYNGSIPGPTLHVRQGSEIIVDVRNDGDVEATVHWHGLRLDNKYDGVPFETQAPIPTGGGQFSYRVRFPDAGLYWYHPHIREDYGLDMGLYGNVVVVPAADDYWAPVNREAIVTLDDVLVEGGSIVAFKQSGPTHVAMGRFGNVMLTGGETDFELVAEAGEVVRFYFTNTANTRLFNIALPRVRLKLVGSDSGRYERESFVDEVLLSPSERAIVDVHFPAPGSYPIEHRTPDRSYVLGRVVVGDKQTATSYVEQFEQLRTSDELVAERGRIAGDIERAPDKTLAFTSLMPFLYGGETKTATRWTCPMHPEIVRDEPGTCPICGMRLVPLDDAAVRAAAASPEHGDMHAHEHGHHRGDGLEWEDLMPEINAASDATNMIWKLVDL